MSDMAGKAARVAVDRSGGAEIQWSEWDEYAGLGSRRMDCIGRWESDRADREIASQRHGRWAGITTWEECCSSRALRARPR